MKLTKEQKKKLDGLIEKHCSYKRVVKLKQKLDKMSFEEVMEEYNKIPKHFKRNLKNE